MRGRLLAWTLDGGIVRGSRAIGVLLLILQQQRPLSIFQRFIRFTLALASWLGRLGSSGPAHAGDPAVSRLCPGTLFDITPITEPRTPAFVPLGTSATFG